MSWQALLPAPFNNRFSVLDRYRRRAPGIAMLSILRVVLLAMCASLTPVLALPMFDLEPPAPENPPLPMGKDLADFLPAITPPVPEQDELALAAPVYAVENIRCEGAAGAWALVYEGKLTDQSATAMSLQLNRRIGFRYHPDYEGVDNSDWWCIPKKRFCYSEVGFSDWGGSYQAESVVAFTREQVFPVSAGLELRLLEKISAKCP